MDSLDMRTRPKNNAGRQFGRRVAGRRGREGAYHDVIYREGGGASGGAQSLCQDERQWRAGKGTRPTPNTVSVSSMTFLVHECTRDDTPSTAAAAAADGDGGYDADHPP